MTAPQLEALDRERAFLPRGRFHELALDYVPFDELTGRHTVDATLDRSLRAEAGCITVVGPTGAGKSATIAAAMDRLKDELPCLRIPVAADSDIASSPVAFGQHILQQAVQQAARLLDAHQRRDLSDAAADRITVHRPTGGVGAKVRAALPGVSLELAGDLKASGIDQERLVSATTVIDGLNRLVGIFEARGGPPVLVFEDTDAWVRTSEGPEPHPAADKFFAESLAVLARDVDVRALVAADTRYTELPGYGSMRERLLGEVEIPELRQPKAPLTMILQKRIDVSQVTAGVEEVFTEAALVRLVAEYDHAARSLRHVLQVCDTALEKTAPTYPERLDEAHLRAAGL